MKTTLWSLVLVWPLLACSSSSSTQSPPPSATLDGGSAEAAAPASKSERAIRTRIALSLDADGQSISFPTQNGSVVKLAKSELVGKVAYFAVVPGGESIYNAKPIDQGGAPLGADLTASFVTPAHYADGPWEVACVIAVKGAPPVDGPHQGDLAAFDNSPPPKGEPPATGVSVRTRVHGDDAAVTLKNENFIVF